MGNKTKHVAQRTCIVCRKKKAKQELNRLVVMDNKVLWDEFYKLPGRGAYVCKSANCIIKLQNFRNLQKTFRKKTVELKKETIKSMMEKTSDYGDKNGF
ncbi:MAG TPA: YlxR family protein [Deltaproteobacteria bacterium]|nr:YlxR family protein [Deltaproteobacteria bacterium]